MRSREFASSYFVTVNRVLNPKIWQGTELDPAVEAKLLKIAEKFQVSQEKISEIKKLIF